MQIWSKIQIRQKWNVEQLLGLRYKGEIKSGQMHVKNLNQNCWNLSFSLQKVKDVHFEYMCFQWLQGPYLCTGERECPTIWWTISRYPVMPFRRAWKRDPLVFQTQAWNGIWLTYCWAAWTTYRPTLKIGKNQIINSCEMIWNYSSVPWDDIPPKGFNLDFVHKGSRTWHVKKVPFCPK